MVGMHLVIMDLVSHCSLKHFIISSHCCCFHLDPLQFSKLFCPTARSKVYMQNIEIFNGRLAMLATVGYAIQEYLTGKLSL